jgi:hypothetical protein
MRLIDADKSPELWEPWMLHYWERCPDCAAVGDRSLVLPPPEMTDAAELFRFHFYRSSRLLTG